MAEERHAGVTLDRCPVCGDVWCDRTELAAVVTDARPGAVMAWGKPRDEAAGEPRQTCPRDATATLRPYQVEGIPFRRCTSCRGIAIGGAALQRLLLESRDEADPLRDGLRRLAD
jgi:Zn-finger nucleic acid-binding protein